MTGARKTRTVFAALLTCGMVLGSITLVFGIAFSSAGKAVALPSLPPAGVLGIGDKIAPPCKAPLTIEAKISLEEPGDTTVALLTLAQRKQAPISEPEPVASSASTVKVASAGRSSSTAKTSPSRSSASTSGWKTAKVSWYGPGFYGNRTASGHILTESSMIVAHRTLPFGTKVQFEYNGRTCTATVQDRGPHVSGREFDLGPGVARTLGFSGVGTVKYRIIG